METFSTLLPICAGNSPVNSPDKGQLRGALMFSLICTRINGSVNNGETGHLKCHRAHFDDTVMISPRYNSTPPYHEKKIIYVNQRPLIQ